MPDFLFEVDWVVWRGLDPNLGREKPSGSLPNGCCLGNQARKSKCRRVGWKTSVEKVDSRRFWGGRWRSWANCRLMQPPQPQVLAPEVAAEYGSLVSSRKPVWGPVPLSVARRLLFFVKQPIVGVEGLPVGCRNRCVAVAVYITQQ